MNIYLPYNIVFLYEELNLLLLAKVIPALMCFVNYAIS